MSRLTGDINRLVDRTLHVTERPRNPHVTRTVSVYARHSADCKHKSKGGYFRNCNCPKWLYIYDGEKDAPRSAKTRSWEEAEKQAQIIRDSFDPVKLELAMLKAERDHEAVTLEKAVQTYYNDLRVSGTTESTINNYARVLGDVGRTGPRFQGGALPRWVIRFNNDQPESKKLRHLSDFTTDILLQWRATWPSEYKWNDYTSYQNWLAVKMFFKWCRAQGYIKDDPAKEMRQIKVQDGARTGVFSDEQMERIMTACEQYSDLADAPVEIQLRVKGFILAMRWGAMAIQDAILLRPENIDQEGVLRYRRVKLRGRGKPAEVQLPRFVVTHLKEMPMEAHSLPGYFFRTSESIAVDKNKWSKRLKAIFNIAHIGRIQTDIRNRSPHSHMFRDTFAVWCIMKDVPLQEISKMLGHTNTAITEESYLPWIETRKQKMFGRMKELFGDGPQVVPFKAKRQR